MVAVALVMLLTGSVLAANSGRTSSTPLRACKSVGKLPLEVTDDGECYELTSNLVWDGASPAIGWHGKRGELHFRGHQLLLLAQCGRGVSVNASGELTVFDAWVVAPIQQYCPSGRAFQATNGTLTLYDARLENMNVGVIAFDSELRVERAQIRGNPVGGAVERNAYIGPASHDGAGVACLGSSVCHIEDSHVRFNQTAASGFPAIQTIGFDRVASNGSTWGEIHIYRSSAVAHQGFNMAGGHMAALHDCMADVLPSLGDPVDPENQLVIGFGFRMGCLRIEQAVVRGCQANLERVSDLAAVAGMEVLATGSLLVDGFNVVGRSPLSQIVYAAPPARPIQKGLIFISPECDHANATSVHLRNVQTSATDRTTPHITVGTNAVGVGVGQPTVMLENWIASDGGAGLVLGSGSRRSVRLRAAQMNRPLYGVYMFNQSSNAVVRDSTFTQHCTAIRAEANANNLIVRETEFMDNADSFDVDTGSFISMNNYNTGDLGPVCGSPPFAFVYDSSLYL